MRKKILIDYQTPEEFEDMKIILDNSDVNNSEIINFVEMKDQASGFNFIKRFLGEKLSNTLMLIYVFIKFQPFLLFTGSPALHHRLSLCFFLFRIKHVIYYRGLLGDPNNISSVSDYVRFKLFKGKFNNKLLNNYLCNALITIGDLNKAFFIARGVPKDRIHLCGLLQHSKKDIDINFNNKKIYFLTTAFKHHHHHLAANDQLDFFKKLVSYLQPLGYDIYIKKHPRDSVDYTSDLTNINVVECNAKDFFSNYKGGILISTFSTIVFEAAYQGIPVYIYSTENINRLFSVFLNEVNYFSPDELLLQFTELNTLNCKNSLDVSNIYSERKTNFSVIFRV